MNLNENNCTLCKLGYYLLNNECISQCPPGYFSLNSTKSCNSTDSVAVNLNFNIYFADI